MAQQEMIPYADDQFMAEALTYVYIGQFARPDGPDRAGILQGDCQRYSSQIKHLLSAGDIQDARWGKLDGYMTTLIGTRKSQTIINNRLVTHAAQLESELGGIPKRCLQYLQEVICANDFEVSDEGRRIQIDKEIGRQDTFDINRASYGCLLSNRDIRDMRDRLFQTLTTLKLVVKAHDYVGTRGGETRNYLYVPAPELQSFFGDYLEKAGLIGSLWSEELEEMHNVFHILECNYNNTLWGQDELDRRIPVRYRDSVNEFIAECLTRKILTESADNKGSYLTINDPLWYNTERAKRYQKPLLDFL